MLLVSTVQTEVFETLLCFEQRLRPGYSMIITKTWLNNIHVRVSWVKLDDFSTVRETWEWTTDIICKGIESAEGLEAKMASVWEEIPAVCNRPDAEWQTKVCRSDEGKEVM